MIKFLLFSSVLLPFVFSCKPVNRDLQTAAGIESVSTSASFTLKPGQNSVFKNDTAQSSELRSQNPSSVCELAPGVTYTLASDPKPAPLGHYAVTITNSSYNCGFRNGYIFAEHVNVKYSNSGGSGSAYCQYSWEEKPGTTDYTIKDAYRGGASYSSPDRSQAQTLQGDDNYKAKSLCQRAQALKHCFRKAVIESGESAAQRFRAWAASKGVDPVLALMAKSEKETKLGKDADNCFFGNCFGIGIAQIITAVDENGNSFRTSDPRWVGITHNILTNLKYSVRVIALKTGSAENLWKLAYLYNGHPVNQWFYANDVEKNYKDLQSCGL